MPAIKPDYQKWYDGLSPDHRALVDKDPTYEYIFKGTEGALDSAGKRPSTDQAGPSAKRADVSSSSDNHTGLSQGVESMNIDPNDQQVTSSQNNTPGSAPPSTMPLTGTGQATASGGGSSMGMEEYRIERPLSKFGDTISIYKKSHKFMTFGIAPAIIQPAEANVDTWLTTYLAEIPWHIPAFYLNQSEYDLLQDGSHVVSLEVEVFYRGSTIQFETATTATGLATLNQINDIGVAYALNKTGWGNNVSYRGFGTANQTMLPTAIAKPLYAPITNVYRGLVADYYGRDNNSSNFKDDIPKHQIARQTFLYNYWALSTAAPALPAIAGRVQYGGWPCLAEKLEQYDGKTVVNQRVAHMNYSPKQGYLKPPLQSLAHGMPSVNSVTPLNTLTNGNLTTMRLNSATNVGTLTSGNRETSLSETSINPNNSPNINLNIYTPIEKAQYTKSGPWGQADPHIQPSLHVGVQPVPALTTAALLASDAVFNAWTDCRAYWDVNCTMVVKNQFPTRYPYATNANVPVGEQVFVAPFANRPSALVNAANDGATYAGLYTNTAPNLTQAS